MWDSAEAGDRMGDLVHTVRTAGINQPPQSLLFSVRAMHLTAYRRPAGLPAIAPQPGPLTANTC
ncbi:hypothetical protein ACI79C_24965 [Geodermatophilus sp. SYSU D00697]